MRPVHSFRALGDSFQALLYRYFFFDWLFADLERASTPFERHAARRHNCQMRRYLPVYLRRWGLLSGGIFLAVLCSEHVLGAQIAAACCYTGFGVTLAVISVIAVAWVLLGERAGR